MTKQSSGELRPNDLRKSPHGAVLREGDGESHSSYTESNKLV